MNLGECHPTAHKAVGFWYVLNRKMARSVFSTDLRFRCAAIVRLSALSSATDCSLLALSMECDKSLPNCVISEVLVTYTPTTLL